MSDFRSIDASVITLTLQPDDPANTTILDESRNIVYTISTTFDARKVPTTSVQEAGS